MYASEDERRRAEYRALKAEGLNVPYEEYNEILHEPYMDKYIASAYEAYDAIQQKESEYEEFQSHLEELILL